MFAEHAQLYKFLRRMKISRSQRKANNAFLAGNTNATTDDQTSRSQAMLANTIALLSYHFPELRTSFSTSPHPSHPHPNRVTIMQRTKDTPKLSHGTPGRQKPFGVVENSACRKDWLETA